jgi:hypothetical protein
MREHGFRRGGVGGEAALEFGEIRWVGHGASWGRGV